MKIDIPDNLIPLIHSLIAISGPRGAQIGEVRYKLFPPDESSNLAALYYWEPEYKDWLPCYKKAPGSKKNPIADALFEDIYKTGVHDFN